jgi:hypothetical protein
MGHIEMAGRGADSRLPRHPFARRVSLTDEPPFAENLIGRRRLRNSGLQWQRLGEVVVDAVDSRRERDVEQSVLRDRPALAADAVLAVNQSGRVGLRDRVRAGPQETKRICAVHVGSLHHVD